MSYTNGQVIRFNHPTIGRASARYAGTLTNTGELLLGTDAGVVIIKPEWVIREGNIAEVIVVWDDADLGELTLVRKSNGPSDFEEAEAWGMMSIRDYFGGTIPMGAVTTVKFQGSEVTYKVLDRK